MNWYRFKTELIVYLVKLVLCVFSALVLATVFEHSQQVPGNAVYWNPEDRFGAAYPWAVPASIVAGLVFLWVLFLLAFRSMRTDSRYRER